MSWVCNGKYEQTTQTWYTIKVNNDPWFSTQLNQSGKQLPHLFFSLFFMNSLLLNLLFINFIRRVCKSTYDGDSWLRKNFGISISSVIWFWFFSATFSNLVIALSTSFLTKKDWKFYHLCCLGLFKRIQKGFLQVGKKNSWVCLGFKRFEDCIEFLKINNYFNKIILSVY